MSSSLKDLQCIAVCTEEDCSETKSDQKLSGWLTRWESGFFLDFLADPIVLLCCNALQVLCLGAPEQSSSYYTGFAPPMTVHVLVKSL